MEGILSSFKQKSLGQKILFFLGLFFSLLYFTLGSMFVYLYWMEIPLFDILPVLQLAFGILLIVYAIFRLFRIIKQV